MICANFVYVLAALVLACGAGVLWMDRVDRDGAGFVQIESSRLNTHTDAIVSDLRGDGPDWLYGATVFGDTRPSTLASDIAMPLFRIASAHDVATYLAGTGYATIDHLAPGAVTPHAGNAPSVPPSEATKWAATV